MASIPSYSSLHIVLFPFMSKGHTIPILHFSHLLLRRGATLTVFTTQANRPFISNSLSNTTASVIDLPFPENVAGVPDGVESTDKLPSMSLFVPFANATKLMKPHFERALEILPRVTFMITDGFLGWTLDSATKFGIPRFVYYGLGTFAMTMCHVMGSSRHLLDAESKDELFEMADFPTVKLTINDFEPAFTDSNPKGPHYEFVMEQIIATSKSYGLIVNSFYELDSQYLEYWNREAEPKLWCLGPFCLADQPSVNVNHHVKPWIKWLDQKLAEGKPIMYVAFGSQAEISEEQLEEIKMGLEKSEASFLWVLGRNGSGLGEGFEDRVRERGLVVREWVDQREILGHKSVQGFLSHCGWNSVLESVCARVPILAWPMMAEQHLNARFVVELISIGLQVETIDGSVRGFVKSEGLEKTVRELMEGEMGKEARKKVKEVGEVAIKAVEEGGSSWQTLNELIDDIHACKT
ncbi:hypothetical protein LguiB_011314 [Lonicera macranthoides]